MTNQPSVVRTRLAFVGVCLAMLATFGWPASVSAHTDFEASDPSDGATVDGPLSSVTVEFTNPAVESGDGFELLEPDGTVRVPDSVDPTDGTSFVVTFDPPLGAAAYGFRWDVQAGDAHPIQGSFQFTVTGPTSAATPSKSPRGTNGPLATPAILNDVGPFCGSPSAAPSTRYDRPKTPSGLPPRIRSPALSPTIFPAGRR